MAVWEGEREEEGERERETKNEAGCMNSNFMNQ